MGLLQPTNKKAFLIYIIHILGQYVIFFDSRAQSIEVVLLASPGIGLMASKIKGVEVSRVKLILMSGDEARRLILRGRLTT